MGAYLSEPVTEKHSSDEENDRVRYGVSSMQGWRISQEDAHNCVIDFDKNASLFAVYDGHGGHEVAVYCSQKLPDFIKETEAYTKGDFEKALIDAFLGFDSTIATRDVVGLLKDIVGVKDNDEDVSDYDEENVSNLYEEASMPIEQVMEKYQLNLLNPHIKKIQGDKLPISPLLKARKSCGESSGCSSSSFGISTEKSETLTTDSTLKSDSTSESDFASKLDCSDSTANTDVTSTNNGEIQKKSDSKAMEVEETKDKEEEGMKVKEKEITVKEEDRTTDKKAEEVTSIEVDNCKKVIKNEIETIKAEKKVKQEENDEKKDISITNGDIDDKIDTNSEKTSSQLNGEGFSNSKKGKGKAVVKKTSKIESTTTSMNLRKRFVGELYTKLLDAQADDSDSDDDNDKTFDGLPAFSSSDDENSDKSSEGADDENDSSDEDSEENEGEDTEEDLYDEETKEFTRNMTEEPGSDSGCTAVLALLRENTVYVANAGDSRCIICRKGEALDMSFDHKPEDKPEMDRILNAGGKVTPDGRVNGGLNLSRAIGDHAYKQNKNLSDREQMITALPDIKSCTINPADDEFMVLACDGIWNFMSSQEVVDFIKLRLNKETEPEKLSQICEELFDHCLAPNTMGDGTGCDNMTAIIVQFKNGSLKRNTSDDDDVAEIENSAKRAKTEAAN